MRPIHPSHECTLRHAACLSICTSARNAVQRFDARSGDCAVPSDKSGAGVRCMKIELHSDEAAAQELRSLGNKAGYSSQHILPIHPENFPRLIFFVVGFFPPTSLMTVTRSCRLQV